MLWKWHPGTSMNSGVLVHETYLKLVGRCEVEWRDRNHFFAVAAKAMRHVLVDYARQRSTEKRGGGTAPATLDESRVGAELRMTEVLALHRALEALAELDARQAQLVELRFFAGLTSKETADVLELSPRTAFREWRKARGFLVQALAGSG